MAIPFRRTDRTIPPPCAPDWWEEAEFLTGVGDSLGLALWGMLRTVRLWSEAPPAMRPLLLRNSSVVVSRRITEAILEAPELARELCIVQLMTSSSASLSESDIAQGCMTIRDWLRQQGFDRAGLYFAEVAALADPRNPNHAYIAARDCRYLGLIKRAVVWYQKAYQAAIRERRHSQAVCALLGAGVTVLYEDDGRGGVRLLEQAVRKSRRVRLWSRVAEAQHEMFLYKAFNGSSLVEVEAHMRQAISLYGSAHERVPFLAFDVAVVFAYRNLYELALPVMRKSLSLLSSCPDAVAVQGALAFTAAALGLTDQYHEHRKQVIDKADSETRSISVALVHLVHAEQIRKDWEAARLYATRALTLTKKWGDRAGERELRVALERINQHNNFVQRGPEPDFYKVDGLFKQVHSKLYIYGRVAT